MNSFEGVFLFRYIIEKKDKFGDWVEALQVNGTDTAASVPNLTPGETYQFRVKAVNKAGPGEPTAASEPVTCRPRRRMLLHNKYSFHNSHSWAKNQRRRTRRHSCEGRRADQTRSAVRGGADAVDCVDTQ